MPIQIIDGFDLGNSAPVDTRFVVGPTSFYQTKDLITYKYAGMRVWDLNVGLPYVWTGTTWSSEASGYVNVSSGTTNYLPKFTGSNPSNLVINSQVYDTGTNVGIGTTTPSTKLHVIGTIKGTFFDGDGSLITNLNATNIVTGTLNISRLQNGSLGSILVAGAVPTWTGSNLVFVGGANSVSISDEISSSTNHDILFSDASVTHPSGGKYVKSYQTGSKKIQFNPLFGQLLMNTGSLSRPSYGFIGSNGTGLYVGSGLSVAYLSTEVIRITSSLTSLNPTSGSFVIGNSSTYTIDPGANFFPNVTPKTEIISGLNATGYQELFVLRHPVTDANAFTRRLGMLMKMGYGEGLPYETPKMGGIMLESIDGYSNQPGLFFLTNDLKRMQIDAFGNIGLGNISGLLTWNKNNIAANSTVFINTSGQAQFKNGVFNVPSISFINSSTSGIYFSPTIYVPCPDPDTLILVSGGQSVKAGDLKVGDLVYTTHETTGVWGDYRVSFAEIFHNQEKLLIEFTDGSNIKVSDSHKFLMTDGQWKKSIDLVVGDSIKGIDFDKIVDSVVSIGKGDVVKIEVDDAHTYVSAGLVSHNKVSIFDTPAYVGVSVNGVQIATFEEANPIYSIPKRLFLHDGMISTYTYGNALTVTGRNLRIGASINAGAARDVAVNIGTINDGITNAGMIQVLSSAQIFPYIGSATYDLILQPAGGRVGIGFYGSNPSYQLHLSTDSAAKPVSPNWTVASDERLKENIELANLNICYDIVKSLKLKRFKWKENVYDDSEINDRNVTGFIAQDVKNFLPKSVRSIKEMKLKDGTKINDVLNLDAHGINMSLYGAVQKLISDYEGLVSIVKSSNSLDEVKSKL